MSDYKMMQEQFGKLLLGPDENAPIGWAREALQKGVSPMDFFSEIFTPTLSSIGEKFGTMEIFLPELIDSAEKAQAVSEQVVKPAMAEAEGDAKLVRGKIAVASVQGDLHDIGKNMVILMLQVNGFEVVDLGIDVPVRDCLNKARDLQVDILGLSSLMTTSMPYMKEVVELRNGLGMRDSFKIIVGGAPITPEYSAGIGAEAYGRDAVDAVEKCIALMG